MDAFFAPVAFRLQSYGLNLAAPAQAYAGRLLALPAMRQWYAEALAEPWRDASHDEQVPRVGTLTEDLRR